MKPHESGPVNSQLGSRNELRIGEVATVPPDQTDQPIGEALPPLLQERGISLRQLATLIDVSNAHLSRALRNDRSKTVGGSLAGRIAAALGLPLDYFVEYRRWYVEQRLRSSVRDCNRAYRLLADQ